MPRRRIFPWMVIIVLFAILHTGGEGWARVTYQVQPGDTLFDISKRMGVSLKHLKKANLLRSTKLKPGQTLVIPEARPANSPITAKPSKTSRETYTVRKGDTLSRIARKTGTTVAMLSDLNHLQDSRLNIGMRLALTAGEDRDASSLPAPVDLAKSTLPPDGEEDDGGIRVEGARAGGERQTKESRSLLGNWNTPDEPQLLVKFAMGFLGAPYRLGGFSMRGLDCSGLVKKIYQAFDIDLPRTAFEQSHVGMRVARSKLIEGDLIFFNTRRALGHVGIYIGNDQFVHASSRNRRVRIDSLSTPYYEKRFVRAVRLKGSDDEL
ncbi:MAG: NlpC/P60 family protein [Thermodesulfobacteriota bacterium]